MYRRYIKSEDFHVKKLILGSNEVIIDEMDFTVKRTSITVHGCWVLVPRYDWLSIFY